MSRVPWICSIISSSQRTTTPLLHLSRYINHAPSAGSLANIDAATQHSSLCPLQGSRRLNWLSGMLPVIEQAKCVFTNYYCVGPRIRLFVCLSVRSMSITALSRVLRTALVPYGNMENSTPHSSETSQVITTTFCTIDNVRKKNTFVKFGWNPPARGRSTHTWNIHFLWLFFLPFFAHLHRKHQYKIQH